MAKRKPQRKKGRWFKWLCYGLIVLVIGGAITFGVIKTIDHFKPADKPGETEQLPETPEGGIQTPEEQIAAANVDKNI